MVLVFEFFEHSGHTAWVYLALWCWSCVPTRADLCSASRSASRKMGRQARVFVSGAVASTLIVLIALFLKGVDGAPTSQTLEARVNVTRWALQQPLVVPTSVRRDVEAAVLERHNIAFVGAHLDDKGVYEAARDQGLLGPPGLYRWHDETGSEPAQMDLDSFGEVPGIEPVPVTLNELPSQTKGLRLYDSGAGVHGRNGDLKVVPGSERPNFLSISTANGVTRPPTKCTQLLPTRDVSGRLGCIELRDSVDLEDCAYTLVSSGKLAAEQGVGFWLAPGDGMSFLRPNQTDHTYDVPLVNIGVMVIPHEDMQAACGGVVFGSNSNETSNLDEFVHDTFNHREIRRLRRAPDCTDAPEGWRKLKLKKVCHTCAKATIDRVSSKSHCPKVKAPGEIVGMDIWYNQDAHVHGGQRLVIGFHDNFSKLDKTYLLKSKSEAPIAIEKFLAWSRSQGVTVKRIHTDNAPEFLKGDAAKVFIKWGVHPTSCSPNEPRQNGAMERRWRQRGRDARAALARANMSHCRSFWWYAWRDAEMKSWCVPHGKPGADGLYTCPWLDFTGRRPRVSVHRPWGIRSYGKEFHPVSKVATQGRRCICLGRASDQPGYMLYDVDQKKVFIACHVHFVYEFPGLARVDSVEAKGSTDVPPYASQTPDVEFRGPEPVARNKPEEEETEDLDADECEVCDVDSDSDASDSAPSQPISQRLSRNRGASHNAGFQNRSAFAAKAQRYLFPEVPEDERFILYLGSGAEREGSLSNHMDADLVVITVDLKIGGHMHDMTSESVHASLLSAAERPNCVGVLVSIDCGSWSALRYVRPGPPTVRSLPLHAEGIPKPDGSMPDSVQVGNKCLDVCLDVCDRVMSRLGGFCVFESPPGRGEGSQFAIKGREDHASMFSYPRLAAFMVKHKTQSVFFDQCRTRSAGEPNAVKTTQLECTPLAFTPVRVLFSPLICNHSGGHDTMASEIDEQGAYKSESFAAYSSHMNELLARALHAAAAGAKLSVESLRPTSQQAPAAPAVSADPMDAWARWDAAHETSQSGFVEDDTLGEPLGCSMPVTDEVLGTQSEKTPCCASHRSGPRNVSTTPFAKLTRMAVAFAMYAAPTAFKPEFYASCAGYAFAAPNFSEDSPSFKQATQGVDRKLWDAALDDEMDNLVRWRLFTEVAEDSLPTWSSVKERASEVVNTLWVLKVKRDGTNEIVKRKGRIVYDGHREHQLAKARGEQLDGFVATARNGTSKCQFAHAAVHRRRCRQLDVEAAYLQGVKEAGTPTCYARPPPHSATGTRFRKLDERGVPIVWRLDGELYGKVTAGKTWNRTATKQLVEKQGFNQSQYDPSFFFKVLKDGTRMDLTLYVDDAVITDAYSPLADVELKSFATAFKLKMADEPAHFLGANIKLHSRSRITLSSKAYVQQLAAKYLPDPIDSYRKLSVPAPATMVGAYERAVACKRDPQCESPRRLVETYASKVGAMIYAPSCSRVDCAYAVNMCARCLAFPTEEMDALADKIIVYMAQTSAQGITYDGTAPNANVFCAYSDSDFALGHSTTGFGLCYGNGTIEYSSKRQTSIATSSTEAEIMAASQCAFEILYYRGLLEEMGVDMSEPTTLYVDNSGAIALSKHQTSCKRSRHIHRRWLKLRELVNEGHIKVVYINTDDNPSDMLTKPLAYAKFVKHRDTLMGGSAESPGYSGGANTTPTQDDAPTAASVLIDSANVSAMRDARVTGAHLFDSGAVGHVAGAARLDTVPFPRFPMPAGALLSVPGDSPLPTPPPEDSDVEAKCVWIYQMLCHGAGTSPIPPDFFKHMVALFAKAHAESGYKHAVRLLVHMILHPGEPLPENCYGPGGPKDPDGGPGGSGQWPTGPGKSGPVKRSAYH